MELLTDRWFILCKWVNCLRKNVQSFLSVSVFTRAASKTCISSSNCTSPPSTLTSLLKSTWAHAPTCLTTWFLRSSQSTLLTNVRMKCRVKSFKTNGTLFCRCLWLFSHWNYLWSRTTHYSTNRSKTTDYSLASIFMISTMMVSDRKSNRTSLLFRRCKLRSLKRRESSTVSQGPAQLEMAQMRVVIWKAPRTPWRG